MKRVAKRMVVAVSLLAVSLCFSSCGNNAAETTKGSNYVLAACANEKRVVLYDMATYDGENLDNNEVWSFQPTAPEADNGGGMSGVKYREDTVFGDVVIVCASRGYAGIVSYPEGEVLWEVYDSGDNPHAIEILPSGNVVVAASEGGTLRLYNSSAVLQNDTEASVTYKEYNFMNAHGVLWDPEYDVLWVVGGSELNAYTVSEDGGTEELQISDNLGGRLPGLNGHDLSADFMDSQYLWVAGGKHVYHFDKKTGEMSDVYEHSDILDRPMIKGFGNNPEGNYFFCFPNGGRGTEWEKENYSTWSTDRFYFCFPGDEGSSLAAQQCVSQTCAYYKVVSFCGNYQ